MRKSLALFATLAALTGCQNPSATTTDSPPAPPTPAAPAAPPPVVYAALAPAARQALVAAELKAIGGAIKAYQKMHGGKWPTSLSSLIAEGLLPAGALISAADPTAAKEGGVPDSYDSWQQSAETDESNCSFLYELSGTAATWDWKSYLAGKPSAASLDSDKNGEVSWQEAKLWQLAHGDTAQAVPAAYPKARFPVVRCYWYGYPGAKEDLAARSVISLAADLETVFLSQPWWEKDPAPQTLP
jgi:hypothetical protein